MGEHNENLRSNFFHYQRSIPGTDCAYLYSSISAPMHRHEDFYEFSLVTYGSFINQHNGQTHTLRKNCLVYFRCKEAHSIFADKDQSTHFSFTVKKERFEAFCQQFFPRTDFFFRHSCVERQLNELQGEYLSDLFKALYICAPGDDLTDRIELFLYNAMALVQAHPQGSAGEKASDRYIDRLLTNLNNYSYVPLKVSQIYEEFPLAQSTLINSFRKRTGYTIVQYLGIKKMEYAAQMLRLPEHTVTDVASAVGISSLSHFIHKFKEHFGITPKEYQLLHAADSAADSLQMKKDI